MKTKKDDIPLTILVSLWCRREEKQYVEGMEDEDMKKETQNLAYPPAFKLEVALFAKKHSQASRLTSSNQTLHRKESKGQGEGKKFTLFAGVEISFIPIHLRANAGKASACYTQRIKNYEKRKGS